MGRCVTFIEELPVVKLTAGRARLVARSGDEAYIRVFDLALWRQFIANEVARLREYDSVERERVVPFPKGKRAGH